MRPLSQNQLTLLDTCLRKFKYVSFDALSGPSTYEQQTTTQWGSQFHLLMQQRALDLPVDVMAGANSAMSESLTALAKAAPDVFKYLPVAFEKEAHGTFSQSEHRRTLAFNGYLLTAIYDLVVISASEGQIFDWKTHQRSPRKEQLQNHWQTRLYLYVLCETTALRPEQLSMAYWFVRSGAEPSFHRFGYSTAQHQQTEKDLRRLTNKLTEVSEQADSNTAFPKVAVEKGLCDRCLFNVRCDRATNSSATSSATDPHQMLRAASRLTADSVEEIPL